MGEAGPWGLSVGLQGTPSNAQSWGAWVLKCKEGHGKGEDINRKGTTNVEEGQETVLLSRLARLQTATS